MKDETAELIQIINRSINFHVIPNILVPCPVQYCDFIQSIIQIKDCDNAIENDGSRDVWGKFNGENFRLKIIKG